jgi:hypothetical protein
MFQDSRQHLSIMVDRLLAHHVLVPAPIVGVAGFALSYQIVEGGFFDTREEPIADRTIWRFHDGFRNPIEELYLARDPLDIPEERFLQRLLRLRVNAPNHFQRHPDRVIRDFHGAHVHKAG